MRNEEPSGANDSSPDRRQKVRRGADEGLPAGQRACSVGYAADCGRWPRRSAPAR